MAFSLTALCWRLQLAVAAQQTPVLEAQAASRTAPQPVVEPALRNLQAASVPLACSPATPELARLDRVVAPLVETPTFRTVDQDTLSDSGSAEEGE